MTIVGGKQNCRDAAGKVRTAREERKSAISAGRSELSKIKVQLARVVRPTNEDSPLANLTPIRRSAASTRRHALTRQGVLTLSFVFKMVAPSSLLGRLSNVPVPVAFA
jgi:hypothetical protein